MKISFFKLFTLTTVFSVLFLSGCGSEGDVNPFSSDVFKIEELTKGNGKYLKGSKIKYRITAKVPEGVKTISYTKTVNGKLNETAITIPGVEKKATTVLTDIEVDASETEGSEVLITVNIVDRKDEKLTKSIKYLVVTEGPSVEVESISKTELFKGETTSVKIRAQAPAGKVKSIAYTKTVDEKTSAPVIIKENHDFASFVDIVEIKGEEEVGKTVKVTFIVTDIYDQTATVETQYKVIVKPLVKGTKTLGAQDSSIGGFFSIDTETAYKFSQAKLNSDKIDWGVGYNSALGFPSIISPDFSNAYGLTPALLNNTVFKVVSGIDIDKVTQANIDAISKTGHSNAYNYKNKSGTVLSFVRTNSAGKVRKGYIKIVNISGSGSTQTVNIKYVTEPSK